MGAVRRADICCTVGDLRALLDGLDDEVRVCGTDGAGIDVVLYEDEDTGDLELVVE